jgi:hypothetical protein
MRTSPVSGSKSKTVANVRICFPDKIMENTASRKILIPKNGGRVAD